MICTNKSCKWKKDGKCVLFAGVRILECKYREVDLKPKKTRKPSKLKKKGN